MAVGRSTADSADLPTHRLPTWNAEPLFRESPPVRKHTIIRDHSCSSAFNLFPDNASAISISVAQVGCHYARFSSAADGVARRAVAQ